ncbi:MAG: HEPN domain-containing protein [Chloroflexi bacterium]|nr:HEPN domain-containing protein [Chloroflexota bacterium]
MYSEIVERQNALDRLFVLANQLQLDGNTDLRIRSAFESYLCIRTYAFVETSIRTILLRYVRQVAGDDAVENFVASQLKRHPNLSYSVLINLLGRFDPEWATMIKESTNAMMRVALDGLVNLRNNIAHGDDVDISLKDLQSYFESSQSIVRLVFETCEPVAEVTTGI